ncbi:hypothetical protein Tco_0351718, partial [Tanacetum coccineum]
MHEMRNKYQDLRDNHDPKNHLNDDTPMCECHDANYIQSEGYQNQDFHNSFSRQSLHDPNDSKKSLIELNNDVRNDLEDFKGRIRSMRTVHWKLYDNNDRKTTGVLPNKKSKTVNQEKDPRKQRSISGSIDYVARLFVNVSMLYSMTDIHKWELLVCTLVIRIFIRLGI